MTLRSHCKKIEDIYTNLITHTVLPSVNDASLSKSVHLFSFSVSFSVALLGMLFLSGTELYILNKKNDQCNNNI